MKKFMLGALLLGIASAANAGSGADKPIELTDQECMAQWNMSRASRSCDVFIWKQGDETCAITSQCRTDNGGFIDNGTEYFPYFKVSEIMNCNGRLKMGRC
ncbi:hypothetical protein [Photorhabdus akhurstii]|uniref:hypothetical protein n=1 Tax=Photorhabdus akhurstii TaxID=171438 RepID=UPI000D4B6C9A|nr:hypothetical protein C6H69_20355 [Photorhabdus luminescens]